MRTVRTLIARGAVVGVLGVAIMLSPGCRKSKAQLEEERRQERQKLSESRAAREEVKASVQRQYDEARELAEQGDYESLEAGWEKLEELAAEDEDGQIAFQFDLYKSEKLPSQVFKKVNELSAVDQERFNEANRLLRFVAENMDKKRAEANRRINRINRLQTASKAYRNAEALAGVHQSNQRAMAIEEYKKVRDSYPDTPYADMAIVQLRNLERPDPPDDPPDPE